MLRLFLHQHSIPNYQRLFPSRSHVTPIHALTVAVLHTGVSVVGARTMGDALRIRVVARCHEITVEGTRTVLIGEAAQVGPARREGIGTRNLGDRRGAKEDLDRVRTAALGPRVPRAWDVAVGAVGGVDQGRRTTPALCDASATNRHRALGARRGRGKRDGKTYLDRIRPPPKCILDRHRTRCTQRWCCCHSPRTDR
jgi:hypothetical protein